MNSSPFARRAHPGRSVALLVLGATAVSLTGATLVFASFGSRSSAVERVPVALVNLDEPVTGSDGSPVAAGRALGAELVAPETATMLDWSLTNPQAAERGLSDGTYDAVVTIPPNFSSAVLSLSGDAPQAAEVDLESDDGTSPVTGMVSEQVVAATVAAFGTDLTVRYLDTTYQSIDTMGRGLAESASGARDLADGAAQVASGSTALTDGTGTLSSSADQLAAGAARLDSATQDLADGVASTARGAADLATGAGDLAAGAAALAAATAEVTGGAAQLAAGADQTVTAVAGLSSSSATHAAESLALATSTGALAATCPPNAGVAYCARVAGVAADAASVARDSGVLSAGLSAASGGVADLAESAASLAAGAADTTAGAESLSAAAAGTATGATSLAAGADQASVGAQQVAAAAAEVDSGASALAAAASDLDSGAVSVASGAQSVASSSATLAAGLSDAAAAVPDYADAATRTSLASTVAAPVQMSSSAPSLAAGRTGIAAVAAVLALWLGAAAVGLSRPVVPRWAVAAPAGAFRMTVLGLFPFLALAGLEALALTALSPLTGLDVASVAQLGLLLLLGGCAIGAVHQALLALTPRRGQVIALLWVLVQMVSLAVALPVQTAPAVVQWLARALPIPTLVEGVTHAVTGGSGRSFGGIVLVLAVWAAAALLATTLVSRRLTTYPLQALPSGSGPRRPVLEAWA